MNALPIVGDICACPEECVLPSYPKGFTSQRQYTSAGYSSSGKKIKAESELTYGSSFSSQEEADSQALERARDRARELLRLKRLVTAQISGYRQDEYRRIAPNGNNSGVERWEGIGIKKPWDHKVTVVLAHLETIEPLWIAIQLLRKQTVKPYIIVVDTGSCWRTLEFLERMRADDLEIHYIRSNGYRHTSAPVALALDTAHSACSTDYLLHTHCDVFLRRDDLIEDLLRICNEKVPIVGYQMSPRDWITNEWEGMIGHSLSMFHMPTIEKTGAAWSLEKACREDQELLVKYAKGGGWPDTETGFNRTIKQKGIKPFFIGHDVNFARQVDGNIDHPRSHTGAQIYAKDLFVTIEDWMVDAMTEALERIGLVNDNK